MNRRTGILVAIAVIVLGFFISGFSNSIERSSKKRYKEGELIVKFKKGVGVSKTSLHHSVIGAKVKRRIFNIDHVVLPEGMTVEDALREYKKNPDVEYAEPNYIFRKAVVPNDQFYFKQWHHGKISSEAAWDITTGSSSVIVAVLDTGIDYNHPDLKDNIWKNPDEICGDGKDNDGNGYPDDCLGWNFVSDNNDPMDDDNADQGSHGTHVAGIIGAVGNNGLGVTGVNWSIKIMALKVLDRDGTGYLSDIIDGIYYAANKGARVINLSLEAPDSIQNLNSLKEAIISAKDKEVLVVTAAGNSGYNLDYVNVYPASYSLENLISVAATGSDDRLGSYSNRSKNKVHLAAPGTSIYSTRSRRAPYFVNYTSTGYFSETGTSMAAPMVSGAAALLLSKNSSYTYKELKELILASVDKKDLEVITGGRLNVAKALSLDLATLPPLKPENLSLKEPLSAGKPISLQWIDLSSTETGYRVERNLKNTGYSNLTTLPADRTTFTDNSVSLNEGDRVSYRVIAFNGKGEAEPAELDLQIPLNRPTGLTATKTKEGIRLNWTDNTTNEDYYEIERQDGTDYYKQIDVVGKDVTTYLDSNLTSASFYYYRVRAKNDQGVYSDYSNEVFVENAPAVNSSKKGCFIATAAYGTPFHPHIAVLREFRDRYLLTSTLGRAFVEFYYRYSPPIAEIISKNIVLRVLVLAFIVPLVYIIKFPLLFLLFAVIFWAKGRRVS